MCLPVFGGGAYEEIWFDFCLNDWQLNTSPVVHTRQLEVMYENKTLVIPMEMLHGQQYKQHLPFWDSDCSKVKPFTSDIPLIYLAKLLIDFGGCYG